MNDPFSPLTKIKRISTPLWLSLGLLLLLLTVFLTNWHAVLAQCSGPCFAEYTGHNVTDYDSADASAVRNALSAASTGGTVKIAGYCAGVATENGTTQVALITQTLTVAGGYTATNWITQDVVN